MFTFTPDLIQESRADAINEVAKGLGCSRIKARRLVNSLDDGQLTNTALEFAPPNIEPEKLQTLMVSVDAVTGFAKIGDGTIMKAIRDFIANNPEVVAIVKAILKAAILALLGL